MKVVEQSVVMLWHTTDPEVSIEEAGRTCYKSEDKITDKSAGAFVTRLVLSGHHAMLEHASASFRIVTDRGISHEIVRHRLASYAQESTRYCNYGKEKFGNEITVIKPPGVSVLKYTDVRWHNAMLDAEKAYFALLHSGLLPEIARSVLPTCLKTEIVMTANLREWRHFISVRSTHAAHPQIRKIAGMIYEHLIVIAPNVFGDLERP
jgi:thymidylate synthase (FAD)